MSRRIAVDPPVAGWEKRLPASEDLAAAFDADLDRYPPEQRRRFIDLLVPLAYSRGKGLPQKQLWRLLASRIADRPYTNQDIRELKEHAGFYLVRDTEHDDAVFRLFHQGFADYLRDLTRHEDVERVIAETLVSLDDRPAGARWQHGSEPYVEHSLPAHAAAGGILERLLAEPDFLLHMAPSALLPHLATVSGGEALAIARAYRRASLWLRDRGEAERLSYLATALFQEGVTSLAERLVHATREPRWMPVWARWHPGSPRHGIARGNGKVTAVNTGNWEPGRPVALVGRETGAAEVWDLQTGALLASWAVPGGQRIREVEFVESEHGRLLIAAGIEGDFYLKNLSTGVEASGHVAAPEKNYITAMHVGEWDGQPVLITATRDLRLTLWNLPALTVLHERVHATETSIYELCLCEVDGTRVLVSGGDSLRSGFEGSDSRLRVWSWPGLDPLWQSDPGETGCIQHIEAWRAGSRVFLLTSQGAFGSVEIWDLANRRLAFREPFPAAAYRAWVFEDADTPLVINTESSGLRVQRLHADSAGAVTLEKVADRIPIAGDRFSKIATLHGRAVLLSDAVDQVLVWDVQELIAMRPTPADESTAAEKSVRALAVTADAGQLIVGNALGQINILDAATGRELWSAQITDRAGIQTLARSGATLVIGDSDGVIHFWNLQDRIRAGEPLQAGRAIQAMTVVDLPGRSFLLCTVETGRTWAARIWDLATREEMNTSADGQPLRFHLSHGEQDKCLHGLAACEHRGRIRFAFAGSYGRVMVADFPEDAPEPYRFRDFDEWGVPSSEEGRYTHALAAAANAGAPLLAAGSEAGGLTLWSFATGAVRGSVAEAHLGSIGALCFLSAATTPLLVSGGDDGALNFWDTELQALNRIDIGEPILRLTLPVPILSPSGQGADC